MGQDRKLPDKILVAANCARPQARYKGTGIEGVAVETGELGQAANATGCLTGILKHEKGEF